ncbi:hypothetical protein [Pseudomonas aeruginosa]|uniref:hypothetical protein n=1 Tax=Pseudomonas aeruginosa TaxID=287 RepID=UPI001EDD3B9F|nr:hypothetical protein [Pseudomonas aeruginosa]
MRVFYTDESFELNGVPLPGIPFLANAGAELIESANRYLFHIAVVRGRTRSPATWRTYADHLYEFFSFLEPLRSTSIKVLLTNILKNQHTTIMVLLEGKGLCGCSTRMRVSS